VYYLLGPGRVCRARSTRRQHRPATSSLLTLSPLPACGRFRPNSLEDIARRHVVAVKRFRRWRPVPSVLVLTAVLAALGAVSGISAGFDHAPSPFQVASLITAAGAAAGLALLGGREAKQLRPGNRSRPIRRPPRPRPRETRPSTYLAPRYRQHVTHGGTKKKLQSGTWLVLS
jgi:hypothetical protein